MAGVQGSALAIAVISAGGHGDRSLARAAERTGRNDFSSMWAGQNTTGCEDVPAAQVTAKIVEGLT